MRWKNPPSTSFADVFASKWKSPSGGLAMSGFADFPGSEVRARLDHPVIDCDAHVVDFHLEQPPRSGIPDITWFSPEGKEMKFQ